MRWENSRRYSVRPRSRYLGVHVHAKADLACRPDCWEIGSGRIMVLLDKLDGIETRDWFCAGAEAAGQARIVATSSNDGIEVVAPTRVTDTDEATVAQRSASTI